MDSNRIVWAIVFGLIHGVGYAQSFEPQVIYSSVRGHLSDDEQRPTNSKSNTEMEKKDSKLGPETKNGKNSDSQSEVSNKKDAEASLIEQGRIAFEGSCTDCHDAARSLEQTKSYDQWMETIRRMAAKKDASIASNRFESIARYLTSTAKSDGEKSAKEKSKEDEKKQDKEGKEFDPSQIAAGKRAFNSSCLKCHDAERSLNKSKSYAEWLSTVRRMAAKDGADIPASEFSSIATYLASLSGAKDTSSNSVTNQGGWSFGTTVSTLHRSASSEYLLENPGFFADVWATASFQSSGAWGATVTACTSCHSSTNANSSYSLELMEGSATVDLRKLITKCENAYGPQLSLKAGRFPVPFGAFSSMSHPGVYRTVTVPLMFNMGRRSLAPGAAPPQQPVLPLPFSDEGFNFIFRQKLGEDLGFGIDAYGVNGLQGNDSNLFQVSRSYTDNNKDPFFGVRTTFGGQFLTLGGSLLNGGLQGQQRDPEDITLWGVDASSQLTERWRVYAEYAKRHQDSNFLPGTASEAFGVVVETEYKFLSKPFLSMVVRYDTLEHRSQALGDDSIHRITSGLNVGMPRGSLFMINHEHWQPESGRDQDVLGFRWSVSL